MALLWVQPAILNAAVPTTAVMTTTIPTTRIPTLCVVGVGVEGEALSHWPRIREMKKIQPPKFDFSIVRCKKMGKGVVAWSGAPTLPHPIKLKSTLLSLSQS